MASGIVRVVVSSMHALADFKSPMMLGEVSGELKQNNLKLLHDARNLGAGVRQAVLQGRRCSHCEHDSKTKSQNIITKQTLNVIEGAVEEHACLAHLHDDHDGVEEIM
jgi:hypothetical protein